MHAPDDNKSPDHLETAMTEMVRQDYAALRRERKRLIFHRTASAMAALCYLLFALYARSGHLFARTVLFLILPMSAIWFSEELGAMTGVRFGRFAGPVVTASSPGFLVRIAGWIVLLLPLWIFLFMR